MENHVNQSETVINELLHFYESRIFYDMTYLGNKMNSLNITLSSLFHSIALQSINITLPLSGILELSFLLELNISTIIACVTMSSECSVMNSMYSQYIQIMEDYNNTKQQFYQQYK